MRLRLTADGRHRHGPPILVNTKPPETAMTPETAMAERRGWASYINGRARDACPYPAGAEREAWLRGYDASATQPHAVLI